MMTKKSITIAKEKNKPILADVTYDSTTDAKPVVIFCHGYKGFKDWGAWNLVADNFANNGFVFLKFNFSYNGGTIDNPIDFPDEEAFGNNKYSLELEDVNRVVDYVAEVHPGQSIYLIGHSRGGGITCLATGHDTRISKLITWAAVADFESRFVKGEKLIEWQETGVMYVLNGRTKQNLPHYYSFYEDYVNNESDLNIKKWVSQIKVPHLIVHGTEDEAVNIAEAHQLQSWNQAAELFTLPTGHTFDTKHPWKENDLPSAMQAVVNKSITFLKK